MRTKGMTKEEIAEYSSKKPIAVYPMSNWGGVEILDIIYGIDDYAIWRFNFGEPEEKIHRSKIKYGASTASITVEGTHVSLGDCMRA